MKQGYRRSGFALQVKFNFIFLLITILCLLSVNVRAGNYSQDCDTTTGKSNSSFDWNGFSQAALAVGGVGLGAYGLYTNHQIQKQKINLADNFLNQALQKRHGQLNAGGIFSSIGGGSSQLGMLGLGLGGLGAGLGAGLRFGAGFNLGPAFGGGFGPGIGGGFGGGFGPGIGGGIRGGIAMPIGFVPVPIGGGAGVNIGAGAGAGVRPGFGIGGGVQIGGGIGTAIPSTPIYGNGGGRYQGPYQGPIQGGGRYQGPYQGPIQGGGRYQGPYQGPIQGGGRYQGPYQGPIQGGGRYQGPYQGGGSAGYGAPCYSCQWVCSPISGSPIGQRSRYSQAPMGQRPMQQGPIPKGGVIQQRRR